MGEKGNTTFECEYFTPGPYFVLKIIAESGKSDPVEIYGVFFGFILWYS